MLVANKKTYYNYAIYACEKGTNNFIIIFFSLMTDRVFSETTREYQHNLNQSRWNYEFLNKLNYVNDFFKNITRCFMIIF